jgi:hypothetical protein
MNDTLKVAGRIGAELGAAKAENERLRGLLQQVVDCQAEHYGDGCGLHLSMITLAGRIKDALSQQPKPTDTYTAVDMATAAAQGFRDGQEAMEPAPAKDETEPVYQFQWREIGEGDWMACSHSWFRFCEASPEHDTRVVEVARPAQTEQQPAYVECRECTDCGHVGINDAHQTDATCAMCDWSGPSPVEDQCPDCGKENVMGAACPKCSGRYRILAETHVAAPIAQTAPQGKFRMGDLVRKTSGSEWQGRICGTYSTPLTPEGYAVESSAHRNSVQIYPAKALELVPMAAKEA